MHFHSGPSQDLSLKLLHSQWSSSIHLQSVLQPQLERTFQNTNQSINLSPSPMPTEPKTLNDLDEEKNSYMAFGPLHDQVFLQD